MDRVVSHQATMPLGGAGAFSSDEKEMQMADRTGLLHPKVRSLAHSLRRPSLLAAFIEVTLDCPHEREIDPSK